MCDLCRVGCPRGRDPCLCPHRSLHNSSYHHIFPSTLSRVVFLFSSSPSFTSALSSAAAPQPAGRSRRVHNFPARPLPGSPPAQPAQQAHSVAPPRSVAPGPLWLRERHMQHIITAHALHTIHYIAYTLLAQETERRRRLHASGQWMHSSSGNNVPGVGNMRGAETKPS